jgi:DNA repair protein RecO (recombination protein O)
VESEAPLSKPRSYQTEAIIIKKVKLGEADRILTFYTPYLGKIQGVARGVRRPRSKMAGHLELLTYSTVSFARGRNLDTVIGSQTIDSFFPLKSDLELTPCAFYVIELVNQFTADDIENYPLFKLLLETMRYLCHNNNTEVVLRFFELHLLNLVGYRPRFDCCISCRMPLEPETNYFSPSNGGVLCPSCANTYPSLRCISANAVKVSKWLLESSIEAAERLKADRDLCREMEQIIREYLRYLLERDVKSTAWMDTIKG